MSMRLMEQRARVVPDLTPGEAVALVSDLCRDVTHGVLPGIPPAAVLRRRDDGRIVVEGPVPADPPFLQHAALLLNDLLPSLDAPPERRAPGALRLVVARALGTIDLPPYRSLDEFCAALDRFRPPSMPLTLLAVSNDHAEPGFEPAAVPLLGGQRDVEHRPRPVAAIGTQPAKKPGSSGAPWFAAAAAALVVFGVALGHSPAPPERSTTPPVLTRSLSPDPIVAAAPAAAVPAAPIPAASAPAAPAPAIVDAVATSGRLTPRAIAPEPRPIRAAPISPRTRLVHRSPVPDSLQAMTRAAAARAQHRAQSPATAQKRQ